MEFKDWWEEWTKVTYLSTTVKTGREAALLYLKFSFQIKGTAYLHKFWCGHTGLHGQTNKRK